MNNLTHKLFILTNNNKKYSQLINKRCLEALSLTDNRDEASILLADPPLAAKQLESFPNLKWLQSTYAGIDSLLHPSHRKDYQLTNVKGLFDQAIAEYVLGYTISYYRHFQQYQHQQKQGIWKPHSYSTLESKRMLILGTGSIGNGLAKKVRSMGIQVSGINRTGKYPNTSYFHQIYPIQELESIVSNADIIVNTLPSTAETYHLIDSIALQHAQGAILFNVGRGSTLCSKGLLGALEAGNIEHAYTRDH